ncbi:TetR family transcriptional regulator [Alkalibaculum sp. M08DMB]|uniref:TetR family transcriptional regulator n=1 Tax=Alkalibaculum sporogenes TaxID=2655001 RepID=A0A6A7KB32_9FIRM|nr:TetR/AcrR family transcriptional regulator [Alkalibaculum sporogenes]MPW26491.1 TetR family transcriptional regulator [Alkalibaculum sporogenes]
MQIKKESVREDILSAAEKEFLKRGFKNSSMRTIAKKSHTTLGNLYTYFDDKEAILDTIIGNTPTKILNVIKEHESAISTFDITKEEMELNFQDIIMTYMPNFFPLDLLLSNSLLILMEGCEGTKYESYRETFLDLFQEHIAIHLNVEGKSFLARSVAHGFLSSLLFIGKNKKNMEEGKNELITYIKVMVLGMPMPIPKK